MMNATHLLATGITLAALCAAQVPSGQGKHEAPSAPVARAGQGTAPRAIMGITMDSVDEALAEQLGVDANQVVIVEDVTDGYGASKAGLKKHDVITKFDGHAPVTTESVVRTLAKKKVGDRVKLSVIRSGETKEFDIELMAAPGEALTPAPAAGAAPGVPSPRSQYPPSPNVSGGDYSALVRDALQRDQELRSQVGKLRLQLRDAEAEVSKRARELAKESANLADRLVGELRSKAQGAPGDADMKKLVDASRELAEKTRDKLENELGRVLEKQREGLDRSMRELESLVNRMGTKSWTATRNLPGVAAPETPGFGQTRAAPAPAVDSTKAIKKVEERLGALEDRLERIEEIAERILSKTGGKAK